MMNISGIESYDEKRCRIFLDGSFYCLLYKGEIRRLQLHEGGEISCETVKKLEQDILQPRARSYVMHLLERREMTEQQVRKKLKEKLYPESVTEYAVEFWKERGYIDDFSYAKGYIQCYRSRYSWKVIREKLSAKGIDRELSARAWKEAALEEIEKEDGCCREDCILQNQQEKQREALRKAMEKKMRSLDMTIQDHRNKLLRHLLGKGFLYTDIQNEMENL